MTTNYLSKQDVEFDSLLPKKHQDISMIHWTPEKIIIAAIDWFKDHGATNILDIGSGVGKFCISGAQKSKMQFTGIENRKALFKQAIKIQNILNLTNVKFINDNIINIDFTSYDAFYYFNPFYEHLSESHRIDKETTYLPDKFVEYQEYVCSELDKLGKGVTVITYCSPELDLPDSYRLKTMMFDELLQLWVKFK